VLNGMAFFWSQWMGKYYNAECLKWLTNDWKSTIVRASMAVDDGGYATNKGEAAKVKAIVDAAIAAGIYVVIVRVRLTPTADFIVLSTEIGEGVRIREVAAAA
jgi:hypothetical protein